MADRGNSGAIERGGRQCGQLRHPGANWLFGQREQGLGKSQAHLWLLQRAAKGGFNSNLFLANVHLSHQNYRTLLLPGRRVLDEKGIRWWEKKAVRVQKTSMAGQSAWKGKKQLGTYPAVLSLSPFLNTKAKIQKTKDRAYEIQRQLGDTSSCTELLRYASPRLSSIQKPPHYF